MSRIKKFLVVETGIILLLSILVFTEYTQEEVQQEPKIPENSLLSPRVYLGVLEPKSYLITNFDPLEETLSKRVSGKNVSIYIQNLRDGSSFELNEEQRFFPLSLNKVPLAISIMQKVERGNLTLETKIKIPDAARDQYSGDLYNIPAKELSLDFLMQKMLSESDNTAFYTLLAYLNEEDLSFLLDYYPVNFDVYYNPKATANEFVYLTANDYSNVFRSLYLSTLLETENSEYLLELLRNNTLDITTVAGLPDNVVVAHKFGVGFVNIQSMHDCGIMYIPEKTRLLYCIMTDGLNQEQATNMIGSILKSLHDYVIESRKELGIYKEHLS